MLISVVISKTDFDGLGPVSGTDTVLPGGQKRRWEAGIGRCQETDWVNGLMILSKANPGYMSLGIMTREK